MLRLHSEITIGDRTFKGVTQLEISSTWESFTDTGSLILPRRIEQDGEQIVVGVDSIFKRGDKIEVKLGYFPNLQTRFVGFVSDIIPELPVVIKFSDVTWLLKQSAVELSFQVATLKEVIDESLKQAAAQQDVLARNLAIQDINTNFIDEELTLGSFRTVGGPVNFVGILEEIKKTYGLVSFAQDNNLFIGSPYILTGRQQSTYEIIFERNVIEHDLVYYKEEDLKIRIKAISMLPDNTKVTAEAGDPGGEVRTFFAYNIRSTKALAEMAEAEISRYKYEGYRGGFTTFGEPFIRHGDKVSLVNKKIPERDGFYLVDGVDTTFGFNGFRQTVRLGPKTTPSPFTPQLKFANELIAFR